MKQISRVYAADAVAMQAILNGMPGYDCTGAFADGNQWEHAIQRSKPNVVLMDIEMPGLYGIEITRLITEKFPEVKVPYTKSIQR